MREAQYTSSIRAHLPEDVYALKLSLPYTAGVADSWYSGPGGDHWVEYKFLKRIPRTLNLVGGKKPIISKLQQNWLINRHEEGRRVAVIVGSPDGGVIFPGISWLNPISRDGFTQLCMPKKEIAWWIASRCQPH